MLVAMKRTILLVLAAVSLGTWLRAEDAAPQDVEQQVAALVARPEVTVVHFWAPWCRNCKTEMRPDGWAKFVQDNPAVKVVFINIWHGGMDGRAELAAAQLGAQENFVSLTHANGSRKAGEKVDRFLGLPVAWVPTTWVFRDSRMRYALNYGEVRFEMLQQMVQDAGRKW